MKYAEVSSRTKPSEVLRFSTNASAVTITLAYFDPFDATFDKEIPVGEFPIDRLRAALDSLDTPTAAIRLREPLSE